MPLVLQRMNQIEGKIKRTFWTPPLPPPIELGKLGAHWGILVMYGLGPSTPGKTTG